MPQPPKQGQLDLFPAMTPAKVAPAIRPWRTALADGWRQGAIERDNLEPFLIDLLLRDRELLEALRLSGAPQDAAVLQHFREHEALLIDTVILLRRGEIVEMAIPLPEAAELPPGFLGLTDVEEMAEHAMESWKAEQDQRPLPAQLRHRTLLKAVPSIWVEATCLALGIEPGEYRHRKDREQAVAQALSEPDLLRRVVRRLLSAPERELLAYVLEKGGQVASGLITRRFGRDAGDGWFWNEEPPRSTLGRVRLHGLAFVGRLAASGRSVRTVAIPREIREALAAVLREIKD